MRHPACVLIATLLPLLACSKTNGVDVGGQPSAVCSNNDACEGACVEGVCRAFCGANYTCPASETCVAVQSGAVCLPPEEAVYPPYQPIDLLRDCQGPQGCQVALDSPMLEAGFRRCLSYGRVDSEVLAEGFDFAGACTQLDSYEELFIKGRTAWRVTADASCRRSRVGQGEPGSVIEFCLGSRESGQYFEFGRLIERGGETYLVKPDFGGGSAVNLYKLQTRSAPELPATCEPAADCPSLPTFPFVGEPAGQYAGLWVECDSDPDCTSTWSEPGLNGTRSVLYIRSDGTGEVTQKTGDAYNPVPTSCATAFRRSGQDHALFVTRRDSSISTMTVVRFAITLDQEYLTTEPRRLSGEPIGSSWALRYKKVALPAHFEDPCEATRPLTAM